MFDLGAIDADLVTDVALILGNTDEGAYKRVRAACLEAVVEGSGTGDQAELYREAHAAGGADYWAYADTAGVYVRDLVIELCGLTGDGWSVRDHLLAQRLDFGNRAAWAAIAERFMPDPDEVDAAV